MMNQVLIAGDSWAAFSRSRLELHCNDTLVTQFSRGGLTARDMKPRMQNVTDVLGQEYKPDHIWLSIGGNDFLQAPKCDPDVEQISTDVKSIIDAFANKYPDAELLLTGYGVPSSLWFLRCNTAEDFEKFRLLYQSLQDLPPNVHWVPVFDLFGGSVENGVLTLSNSSYYADPVHLNAAGYERLFTFPPVSEALGCQPEVASTMTPTPSPTASTTTPTNSITLSPTLLPTLRPHDTVNLDPNNAAGAFSSMAYLWPGICLLIALHQLML